MWLTLSVSALLHRFATRLVGIKENAKFQKSDPKDTQVSGLKSVVDNAKQRHNVKYVLYLISNTLIFICNNKICILI